MTSQQTTRSLKFPVDLPPGYGIAQLDDGRFYPLWANRFLGDENFSLSPLYWQYQHIPFALSPRSTHGMVSFASLVLAVAYCYRCADEWKLLWDLERHTRMTPMYPERSQWYEEAITKLLAAHHASPSLYSGNGFNMYVSSNEVIATLHYWQVEGVIHNRLHCIEVRVATVDDVMPALYDAVSTHFCSHEAVQESQMG